MLCLFVLAALQWTLLSTHALNLPLQLASQQNNNASADIVRLGSIPNPFIYDINHDHRIVFKYKPIRYKPPADGLGISPSNWFEALGQAGDKAKAMQEQAHVGIDAHVPGNHFEFENTLAHPSSQHVSRPRRIRFEFNGRGNFELCFVHVHVLLNGMFQYGKAWIKPRKNDQVRMCNFTMYWLAAGAQYESANGSANMVIPSGPGAIATS